MSETDPKSSETDPPREGVLPPLWDRFRVIIIKSIYINAPPGTGPCSPPKFCQLPPLVLPPSKRGVKLARNRGQKPTMEKGLISELFSDTPKVPPKVTLRTPRFGGSYPPGLGGPPNRGG